MGAALDRVFVIDVEATCWETREEQGDRPNEIIEIGICVLHKRDGIKDISSYLVKPQFTEISPFCTQLTGHKPEDVADAANIADTLIQIGLDYSIEPENVWFSYGEYDRVKLSSDKGQRGGAFDLYGIERKLNPIGAMRGHFNVKTLMALKEGLSKEMGMDRALKYYGETLEGRHHNGADDAANIAKIVRRVLS
jgi:inhibitor of KinA sporulation pathway (predicted exonuclease)